MVHDRTIFFPLNQKFYGFLHVKLHFGWFDTKGVHSVKGLQQFLKELLSYELPPFLYASLSGGIKENNPCHCIQ